ncbi:uncharacterized protein CELE_R01B10.2 [Caenorhabditis elegans]|uniref:Uncharacterized protein n=1 Tax=Caenorhabditis elegans TaxID=6239 RepID=O61972_CAEEL|nr:Uncharacterized protein CELE_R01B10.2 [Caenorhabditis elegans]CCD70265.2 Uncharacterized protein CELE_R01B10.2 [Caenorhabditis elegans]|eukprot:NP_001343664.1 Uncharacterized protein CELE_R01B10.2 [Caenorhabditis elegans]
MDSITHFIIDDQVDEGGSCREDRDQTTMERGSPETRKMIYDENDDVGSGPKDRDERTMERE